MTLLADLPVPEHGKIVANITHFARALRKAGLPVGPGRVADAIRAVAAAGFTSKRDFFWTLHACFVSRPEHREVFAQIFRLYWRDPQFLEHMMAMLLPAVRGVQEERAAKPAERRAAEALLDGAETAAPDLPGGEGTELEIDASMTFSAREMLRSLDFEQMTAAEDAEAKRMIARIALPVRPLVSRRSRSSRLGHLPDWRGTVRGALRNGGEIRDLALRRRRTRWPNLVALCDISGSMSAYSRVVLHFLHAASNARGAGWAKVHSFTFGTRLTNITRHLRRRDVDAALALAGAEAQDWEGGTRIGECLHRFNRDWSRRVLGQGAVVLLITDGLDRDDPGLLATEMERLHLSARRVIWINPLLRWDGFAPKARGIREMLPHVDSFRAGHNIASLQALAEALSRPEDVGERARLMREVGQG
ncbi:MAG: VWA domain-containing protein [Paracoccaceae bacterium]